MPLVICPDRSRQVSDQAASCPQCGRLIERALVVWTVRWSSEAELTGSSAPVSIRPPGLHFVRVPTGEKRFLFCPPLLDGELEAMPESRLLQLLERPDTPTE